MVVVALLFLQGLFILCAFASALDTCLPLDCTVATPVTPLIWKEADGDEAACFDAAIDRIFRDQPPALTMAGALLLRLAFAATMTFNWALPVVTGAAAHDASHDRASTAS